MNITQEERDYHRRSNLLILALAVGSLALVVGIVFYFVKAKTDGRGVMDAIPLEEAARISKEIREANTGGNERLYGKRELVIKAAPDRNAEVVESIRTENDGPEEKKSEVMKLKSDVPGKGWIYYAGRLKGEKGILISPEQLAEANGRTVNDPVYLEEELVVPIGPGFAGYEQ